MNYVLTMSGEELGGIPAGRWWRVISVERSRFYDLNDYFFHFDTFIKKIILILNFSDKFSNFSPKSLKFTVIVPSANAHPLYT